jgi:hypothetical protein
MALGTGAGRVDVCAACPCGDGMGGKVAVKKSGVAVAAFSLAIFPPHPAQRIIVIINGKIFL